MVRSIAIPLIFHLTSARLAFVATDCPNWISNGRRNGKCRIRSISSVKMENEWGIPDSETLPSLSPYPLTELSNGGRVSLVGAGPGDPELLTLSAYRLLRDPDVMVIADRLVSDEILEMITTEDIRIARKMPGCADLAQEEIYAWTYQGLQEGKHVVRLKIGDPFVFGRGGEEVLKIRKFGVEATVIPVRGFFHTCTLLEGEDVSQLVS
jgi:Tetrapyrrole (Corrin/Porphyrin) Methylases